MSGEFWATGDLGSIELRCASSAAHIYGELAHQGVKSRFTVHSGLSVDPSGGGNFKGELRRPCDFGRPLAAAEIAKLAKSRPASGSALPAIIVARVGKGNLEAGVARSGSYNVHFAGGQTCSFQVPPLPLPLEIPGPWEVRFPANMDVPEHIALDKLMSLTEHTNEAIR